ncbi:MAG: UDP-glucose/GDP-mannose dehydrogenase family protein [Verrucomicrobiales bacterium]|nr:UDP-glucose/GDP-mannose dehydrogenase family protein [Verrucomicrobiales bacterium]
MKVSIFGLGYVGCVTAACLAKDGHEVVGVDVVASKVARLAAGQPTVVETGLDELIADAKKAGKLTATTDARAAVLATDASIICVGTPNARDGSLDLSAVRQTAEAIGRAMLDKPERHVVVLRSTVPAGTCENVVMPALHPDTPHIALLESDLVIVPEFLREGCAIADYYDPPFVVVGSATGKPDDNATVVQAVFGGVTDRLQWLPFREAEMLKATCNVFHALKVAFANEIGALCSALSIDGKALMAQLVQDQKLNISPAYLRPGLPFGGSCLPKDLRMILSVASRNAVDLPLLRSLLPSNDAHLKRAIDMMPSSGARRIGLNGLAFKSGTDDLRESPIVLIAEHLIGKGYDLRIHDPGIETSRISGANRDYIEKHIPHLSSRLVSSIDELVHHSEVVLLVRDGQAVVDRAAALGKRPTVIDLRGKTPQTRKAASAPAPAPAPKPVAATATAKPELKALPKPHVRFKASTNGRHSLAAAA